MSQIPYMRISEITTDDLVDYLRLPDVDSAQLQLLTTIKAAAINFIVGVTALSIEQLDNYPDLTLAVYARHWSCTSLSLNLYRADLL